MLDGTLVLTVFHHGTIDGRFSVTVSLKIGARFSRNELMPSFLSLTFVSAAPRQAPSRATHPLLLLSHCACKTILCHTPAVTVTPVAW